MNEFERRLKELFPDIYELYLLGKERENGGGGEVHVWDLVQCLLEMNRNNITGNLYINYNKGRIDSISLKKDVLAYAKQGKMQQSIDKDAY